MKTKCIKSSLGRVCNIKVNVRHIVRTPPTPHPLKNICYWMLRRVCRLSWRYFYRTTVTCTIISFKKRSNYQYCQLMPRLILSQRSLPTLFLLVFSWSLLIKTGLVLETPTRTPFRNLQKYEMTPVVRYSTWGNLNYFMTNFMYNTELSCTLVMYFSYIRLWFMSTVTIRTNRL